MSGDKDYKYDGNEQVSLHDSDSGANSATGLDGYTGNVELAPGWPGTVRNRKELRADPQVMRDVVSELRDLADDIRAHSSVRNIGSAAGDVQLGSGDWMAATYLRQAGMSGAGIVEGAARQIATNLDLAAQAIEMAADSYDDADGANRSGFRG